MPGSSAREARRGRRLRRVLGVGALMLGLPMVADADQSADMSGAERSAYLAHARSTGDTPTTAPSPPWTGTIAFAPVTNAAAVPVTDPVTVTVTSAILDSVTLTSADGKQVAGGFDADRRAWHATGVLGYNRRYMFAVSATDLSGRRVTRSSTFTTVRPSNLTLAYLQANAALLLTDRKTYGVGQPVVVRFDEKVPDRAAAQGALEVITEPHVDGAWHWFSDQELHWRPPAHWTPGTKVTVNAKIYGKHLGGGLYGQRDSSASFTIGPSKIAIADDNTHRIQVTVNGRRVRTVPTSMGKHESTTGAHGQRIDFRTRSGVHVVLGNERVTRMTSASFGITSGPDAYDQRIEWTTHMSYAGEYLHAAPWSVADQGVRDVSHGCLNVSTQDAIWFYNNFGPGDIIEVRNTGIALDPTDGLGDWTLSWEQWTAGSALPPSPSPTEQPTN